MGMKRVMVPVEKLDLSAVKYEKEDIQGHFLEPLFFHFLDEL